MRTDELKPFDGFADDARLWLAAFPRTLLPEESAKLKAHFETFRPHWKTHGEPIDSAFALLEDRILAVAERTMGTQPSGCAIDTMLRQVYKVADLLGLPLLDAQKVLVRASGGLAVVPKARLEAMLQAGELDGATPVVDLSLQHLGELRDGRLERALAQTWIGRKYASLLTAQA